MRSQLFKRAKACTCDGEECTCPEMSGSKEAKAALETVDKLAKFFDAVDARFEHLRWASEAKRDLQSFLNRKTDIITASVGNTIASINDFHSRLAASDFNYDSMVDETSPNDMFDAPEPIFDDLKDDKDVTKELGNDEVPTVDTTKTAGSSLMGGGTSSPSGSGPWADLPTESLTKIVKALSGDLEDKAVQGIVAEVSSILAERSPEPEEAEVPETPKVSRKARSLRLAATDPVELDKGTTSPECNLKGDSLDDSKKANNGDPVNTIQDLEVLEGDKSVTANNGDPVNTIQDLEVLEGDKSVTAKQKSSRLLGLRIASIE